MNSSNLQIWLKRPWVVWILWAVLTALYLWWPCHIDFYTDEAYFSEMTLRTLRGELPNIDFASNYIGLFYVYNALWFLIGGVSYWALRMGMLFLTSVLFIPSVYFLASKAMSPRWAIGTTLSVLALTVSMNNSASGNWYALYFSLVAILAFSPVLAQTFSSSSSTLSGKFNPWFLTGLLLGVSFLMKHPIAFFTGLSLWLAYLYAITGAEVQNVKSKPMALLAPEIAEEKLTAQKPQYRVLLFWMLNLLLCVNLPILATAFVFQHLDVFRFIFYILPVTLISLFWIPRLWRNAQAQADISASWQRLAIAGIGFITPILLYLAPYAYRSPQAVLLLFQRVFVEYPAIYLNFAFLDYASLIHPAGIALGVCFACFIVALNYSRPLGYVLLCLAMGVVFLSGDSRLWSNLIIQLYLQLPLWGLIGGTVWFFANRKKAHSPLLVCFFLWGLFLFLGTYPLGMMFYVGYCLTPWILWLVSYGFVRNQNPQYSEISPQAEAFRQTIQQIALAAILLVCLLGGLMAYRQISWFIAPAQPIFPNQVFTQFLSWPRARIWISESNDYTRRTLAYYQLVKKFSTRADDWFMYSDGPEVYFLSEHTNPTRYSYAIDSRLSDGQDVIDGLERHQTQFIIYDVSQNHFMQPKLDAYLNRYFRKKLKFSHSVYLFQRKP